MGNRAAQLRANVQAAHPGAVVVERTPKGIKHQLPADVTDIRLGQRRFVLDATVGGIHHHDGVDWVESDTTLDDLGGNQGHRGRTLPHGTTIGPSGIRRIEPRASHPLEWVEFKRIEQPGGGPNWNEIGFEPQQVTDNVVHWVGSPAANPDYELEYAVTPGGVKATYVALNVDGAVPIRWEYTTQGLTVVGDTLVSDADSEVVMYFQPASLVDADRFRRDVPQTIDATHITLTPDYTDLAFPVQVDPTVNVEPAVGVDDGQVTGASGFSDIGFPAVGNYWSAATSAWYRFPGVTIPQGASIDVAYITQLRKNNGSGTVTSDIYAINEDNHTAPTSRSEWATDHGIHTSGVTWDFATVSSGSHDTPSIVTPIQTVIDRSGWSSGNAIGIHIDDDSSTPYQLWDETEGSTPANLHIEFTHLGPQFRAAASIEVDGGTAWNVGSASATQNDLVLIYAHVRGNSNFSVLPSGFTQLYKETGLGSTADMYCWWKVAGASPPTTYDFTTDAAEDGTMICVTISDVNTTTPINVSSTNWGAASTSHVATTVTPSVSDTLLVAGYLGAVAAAYTPPTGFIEQAEKQKSSSYAVTGSVHTMPWASGATGNITATFGSSSAFCGMLIAVAGTAYSWDQEGYRWRKDDGSESAATWHAAQDTDITTVGTETTTRLRMLGDATGDPATAQMKLQYRKVGDADSEWEDIST